MNSDDFKKKMENLIPPRVDTVKPPADLKLTLMNAQRSAAIGVWLIAIPCYFLLCVLIKFYFHLNLRLFDVLLEMVTQLNKNPFSRLLVPLLLWGAPLLGIFLNALAIMHFQFNSQSKEFQISIKLRWQNLILIGISLFVLAIFLGHEIVESIQDANK